MGPARRTIFFGLSAAKLRPEKRSKPVKTRKQKDLAQVIGDAGSVTDFRRQTRSGIERGGTRTAENLALPMSSLDARFEHRQRPAIGVQLNAQADRQGELARHVTV